MLIGRIMGPMRMTVTLDYDVAELIERAAHSQRRSKKSVVNEALRRALSESVATPSRQDSGSRRADAASMTEVRTGRPLAGWQVDVEDYRAISEALTRYFGLPAPPPHLYLVRDS